jgi:hypothetical protein
MIVYVLFVIELQTKQVFSRSFSVRLLLRYFQCYGVIKPMPISSTISFEFLCDVTMDNYGYYVTGAALWYLVFLWVCRHIWFPEAERIAKSEKYVFNLSFFILQFLLLYTKLTWWIVHCSSCLWRATSLDHLTWLPHLTVDLFGRCHTWRVL